MSDQYDISDPEYKRIKFEVFEKDSFKCQFCGTGAPIVTLQLSRINDTQQSDNWLDTAFLSTSCKVCENKKTASDQNTQRNGFISIDELEERLQQLKMLINWRKGMLNIRKQQLANLVRYWENKVPGYSVDNDQKKYILTYITKYSCDEIRSAMDMAADKFFVQHPDGTIVNSSVLNAFGKVPEICSTKSELINAHESDGLLSILEQIKNNITGFFDPRRASQWLNYARSWEVQIEHLFQMASSIQSWTEFSVNIDKMVEKQKYVLSRGRVEN